jgi:sugar/nucleoside kinase (ribokinase family)
MTKRIGIVGSFVLDKIFPLNGNKIEGIGGLYYSLIISSLLVKDSGSLYPFAKVGGDFYPKLVKILRKYYNIETEGLIKVFQPNNKVSLYYYSENERREYSTYVLPYLRYNEFKFLSGFDIFYINFISGRELKLQTLLKLRKNLYCPFYIDFHSLSLGFRKNGLRYIRPFPNWRKWLKCGDIIQMNEREGRLLFGREFLSDNDYLLFAKEVLSNGSKVLLLTLGEDGSILFYETGKGIKRVKVPPFFYGSSKEATGCGDAYAGGFLSEYLRSGDLVNSTIFASKVAGYKASLFGSDKLDLFAKFKG